MARPADTGELTEGMLWTAAKTGGFLTQSDGASTSRHDAIGRLGTSSARNKSRTRGVAAEELRRHNLALVLERLHLAGPARRTDLTAATGLNRSTVGALIGELTDLGLVVEGPSLAAEGPGRPSPVVRVRPGGAVAIAVEVNVDSIGIGCIGLGGHVFAKHRVERPADAGTPAATIRHIADHVERMCASLTDEQIVVGVGVAVAGVTRLADGYVHLAPNLAWKDVPVAELLAEALAPPVPIHVANDADLGALAEHRRGTAVSVQDAIYVHGEAGIGTGIVVDGRLMRGATGYAGEAGHMVVNPHGRKCRCGSIGCWETEAGEGALMERIGGLPGSGLAALNAAERLARKGDRRVLDALEETASWLGLGIANLVNVLNPEMVVLGGFFHRFYGYLHPGIEEALRTRALSPAGERVRVVASQWGEDGQLVGAAELALLPVLSDPAGGWSGQPPRVASRHGDT